MSVAAAAHAQPASGDKLPIVVNGDQVEYMQQQNEVRGSGNISIVYKDVKLTCDSIVVNLATKEAVASGNVVIIQNDAQFIGSKITYNFETRQAHVDGGEVSAKPFYGKAGALDKVANKDEYHLYDGYVTTCDYAEPHYRIATKHIEIYPGDRVVAHHVVFYLGNVPVMYLPYYVQPLNQPKTHLMVVPGQSKDWGYYVLGSCRYYINEDHRGDFLLDYRSKKGLATGINHYYDTYDAGSGAAKFYIMNENDATAYEKMGPANMRYRVQERHRWDIEEYDTNVTFEFNKLSDPDVIKDYFYNEYEEIGTPDNYVSFITTKRDFTTQFLVRKRFDNFYTVLEREPEFKIDIMNYKIGNTDAYYTSSSSAAYLNQTYQKQMPSVKDMNTIRFDTYNQLAYSMHFFRTLNITPYAGNQETFYSRNRWGDTNEIRTLFKEGIDASMKFYKIYDVNTNWLGLDINRLRHVITPTANYVHIHQPTIAPENLNQFDAVDAIDTTNSVLLGIENRLQTKRLIGGQMKSVDLATLLITSDYMFRLEKNNLKLKSNKFNTINMQLELIPYSWAYLLSKATVDPKKQTLSTASIDLVMNGGEKWSFSMGNRFENVSTGESYLVTMEGVYKFNNIWKARVYERFDLVKQAFQEQEYTVYRDLHCWTVEFTLDLKDNNNVGFWIMFRLNAFPDYPIGLKRTFSTARYGEAGATPAGASQY